MTDAVLPERPFRFSRGRVGRLFAFLTGMLLVAIAIHAMHLAVNTTESMPIGVYTIAPLAKPVASGDIVSACPPLAAAVLARQRDYLLRGDCGGGVVPMLKIVLATAGDSVVMETRKLTVNGRAVSRSALSTFDSKHRPLQHLPLGTYKIPSGYIWLWSPHPRSWDSRYYGLVPVANVRGTASLVLPFGPWPYASRDSV